jgi:hypothetical protein
MLPIGEDEIIRKRFRSVRREEEREAPSFDRVVARALAPSPAPRSLAPWLAIACLTLAAAAASFLLATAPASRPTAPVPSEAAGHAPEAPAPATERAAPADVNPQKAEVEPLPVADQPRKSSKPDRTTRRQKPAQHEECAEC